MNYKIPLALAICSSLVCAPTLAEPAPAWKAITFGQSTDLNFSSNVLAGKIGVNDVTIAGKKLTPETIADLSKPITLESRGGKIANSHDGLTFFYTKLPVGKKILRYKRTSPSISLARKMAQSLRRKRARAYWCAM